MDTLHSSAAAAAVMAAAAEAAAKADGTPRSFRSPMLKQFNESVMSPTPSRHKGADFLTETVPVDVLRRLSTGMSEASEQTQTKQRLQAVEGGLGDCRREIELLREEIARERYERFAAQNDISQRMRDLASEVSLGDSVSNRGRADSDVNTDFRLEITERFNDVVSDMRLEMEQAVGKMQKAFERWGDRFNKLEESRLDLRICALETAAHDAKPFSACKLEDSLRTMPLAASPVPARSPAWSSGMSDSASQVQDLTLEDSMNAILSDRQRTVATIAGAAAGIALSNMAERSPREAMEDNPVISIDLKRRLEGLVATVKNSLHNDDMFESGSLPPPSPRQTFSASRNLMESCGNILDGTYSAGGASAAVEQLGASLRVSARSSATTLHVPSPQTGMPQFALQNCRSEPPAGMMATSHAVALGTQFVNAAVMSPMVLQSMRSSSPVRAFTTRVRSPSPVRVIRSVVLPQVVLK